MAAMKGGVKRGGAVQRSAGPAGSPLRNAGRVLKRRPLLGAAILLLVVASTAYAVTATLARKPDAVLRQALGNSLQAQAVDADLDLRIAAPGQQPGIWRVRGLVAQGGVFDLAGRYAETGGSVSLNARSPAGGEAYVRFTDVGQLPALLGDEADEYGITGSDNPLQRLQGVWLSVPADLKETVLRNQAPKQTVQVLDTNDRRRMAELYGAHPFLSVGRTLPDEPVDGRQAYHYEVRADQSQLEAYLRGLQRDVPKLQLDDRQVGSVLRLTAKAAPAEVWITKDDMRFARIDYRSGSDTDGWRARLLLRDYGRDGRVAVPSDARPLFEALGELAAGRALQ